MAGQVSAQTSDVVSPTSDEDTQLTPIPQISDEDWVIEIIPARKAQEVTLPMGTDVPVQPEVEGCVNCAASSQDGTSATARAATYTQIYESIPFNRAEYNVNPSYRHDSTMEILTGNARHRTIVRHGTTRPQHPTTTAPATAAPYPYLPYGYIRPAVRFNYYRYFPSLRPFWNPSWYGFSGIF